MRRDVGETHRSVCRSPRYSQAPNRRASGNVWCENGGGEVVQVSRCCSPIPSAVPKPRHAAERRLDRAKLCSERQSLLWPRLDGGKGLAPNYQQDIDLLQAFSAAGLADVSEEIVGFRVERPILEKSIRDCLTQCRLVNLSGLPGCGMSAMLKRIASVDAANGPILFLKSDHLEGSSWLTFAATLGLNHRVIADLLAEIGGAGTPILFIDGIDRVRPDQTGIIADILRAIEDNEQLANWKVLASSRDQGLEA